MKLINFYVKSTADLVFNDVSHTCFRLCNAYLASGRGGEYLEVLTAELDEVISSKDFTEERVQSLKDKFPRGGAMGLLESNPELVDAYTSLAHKFLILGYVAPMNVLWTYHFIGGRHELATPLWDKYVKTCPQIMFQKVSSEDAVGGTSSGSPHISVVYEQKWLKFGFRAHFFQMFGHAKSQLPITCSFRVVDQGNNSISLELLIHQLKVL